MGLQLALLGYIFLYKCSTHFEFIVREKNGNVGYNLQRQTVYAVCIIVSFLKNKVSESVAPKDDGRDTRVPLVGFRGGGMDAVFACGLWKRWGDKYADLHEIAFTELANKSLSCSSFLP